MHANRLNNIRLQIKKYLMDAVAFLSNLINIKSYSGNEKDIASFIAEEFKKLGVEVTLIPLEDSIKNDKLYCSVIKDLSYSGRHNIAIRLRGKSNEKGAIVFNTHIDTVPDDKNGLLQHSCQIKDDMVFGRGACDAKGQIACMYLVIKILTEMDLIPPRDILLHLVVEEEIGGNGTLALMKKEWPIDRALIMEPTDLKIMTAARGAIWFKIKFFGKAGHSGHSEGTISALKMALEAIRILEEYHRKLLFNSKNIFPFEKFSNPMPITFGVLKSGEWPAIVPENAELEGVIGFLQNKTSKMIIDEIIDLLDNSYFSGRYAVEFPFIREPSITDINNDFVRQMINACDKAGLKAEKSALTAYCDAWFYSSKGIPTLIFGPGSIKDAHTSNECIKINHIAKAAEVLIYLGLEEA